MPSHIDGLYVSPVIKKYFELTRRIGAGAYGYVWKAIYRDGPRRGRNVAIKRCFDAWRNAEDALRTYREVMLLQKLNGYSGVVRLLDCIQVATAEDDHDLYLVYELLECDIEGLIKKNVGLTNAHRNVFIYQFICALKYIHSASVVHRDLKPANLLLNSEQEVTLADFGMARNILVNRTMTVSVGTSLYRSPELILGAGYSEKADIWAAGLTIGEFFTFGRPLVTDDKSATGIKVDALLPRTGDDERSRKLRILCLVSFAIGVPSKDDLEYLKQKCPDRESRNILRQFRDWLLSPAGRKADQQTTRWYNRVSHKVTDHEAFKLVNDMLQWNPDHRPSADKMLEDNKYFENMGRHRQKNREVEWRKSAEPMIHCSELKGVSDIRKALEQVTRKLTLASA